MTSFPRSTYAPPSLFHLIRSEHRYHCSGWFNCCLFYRTGAGQEIDLELVIEAAEPAHLEETVLCDLNHSSSPVYVYVKASFEVSAQFSEKSE